MRMVRTSTTSCTCLCDPPDGASPRPHLSDSQTLGTQHQGQAFLRTQGCAWSHCPCQTRGPLTFTAQTAPALKSLYHTLCPLSASFSWCRLWLVRPHLPTSSVTRVIQTGRDLKQGTEGLRGRGRFKTTENPNWVLLFPSLTPWSIAEGQEVQGLLRVTRPLI